MIETDDIININNQIINFEDLFNKKINKSSQNYTYLSNKIILVTGAAGSIGSSLIKSLLQHDINQIIALDHSEYGIFQLGLMFKKAIENKKLHLFLGDIRNQDTLDKIFTSYPIQIIYHAAAYKHISILETNSEEAVSVNIEATIKILHTARKNNTEQFIFISTDKAVNPINIMGISKRVAELLLIKEAISKKENLKIKIIRFGNVFNSNGSIFNIFKFQIENKIPITITHKKMKRYFISKYQAINGLVILSDPQYDSGIFLLNMGFPFKIDDILHKILDKVNLDYTPTIIYEDSNVKDFEKFEEELYFDYEEQQEINSECMRISLDYYNLKKIDCEIQNYRQLLKN